MPSDLTLPASEQVAQGSTTDISGISYTDSSAAGNPGEMYLSITDSSGALTATDSAGTVPGSGTNSITLDATTYADVQAILGSLAYVAPGSPGSDTISFDLWDQDGVESTGTIPVSVSSGGATETWTGAVSSDWNTPGNWSGNTVPGAGNTAVIPGATPNDPVLSNAVLNNETIVVDQIGQQQGNTIDLNGVTLGAGSALQVDNPTGNSQDVASIVIGGTLTVDAGAQVSTGSGLQQNLVANAAGAAVINAGTISNTGIVFINGGTVVNDGLFENQSIEGAATISNQGTILIDSMSAGLGGTVAGGTIEVGGGRNLEIAGTLDATAVQFIGPASLRFDEPNDIVGNTAISGFGSGDEIWLGIGGGLSDPALSFANGTLDVSQSGTHLASIPFNGNVTLGNFAEQVGGPFVYAPDNGYTGLTSPDIAAPDQASVTQGSTLILSDVTIANSSTFPMTVTVTADSGELFMNGASGSGTSRVTVSGSTAEVNADLSNLAYVPAPGTTSDTIEVNGLIDFPSAFSATNRWIPISISGNSGPTLSEPSSESVAADGTITVQGTYTDSVAAGNPGAMYLAISDSSGTLYADYGQAGQQQQAPGSGTNTITFQGSYGQVDTILNTLTYVAGAGPGSDNVHFDLWNQAGVETTGDVPVTVTSGGSGGGSPTLAEPANETVAQGGTVSVNGSYSDSFAQNNPGQLFLGISDSNGTLSAQDASGQTVAGSGTNSIALNTDYVDLNAILASLHYTAGANAGSDSIQFEVWNQAGVESTGITAVTVGAPANAIAMSQQDLAAPAPLPDVTASSVSGGSPTAAATLNDVSGVPPVMPLNFNH
jgi:hypothetical protein